MAKKTNKINEKKLARYSLASMLLSIGTTVLAGLGAFLVNQYDKDATIDVVEKIIAIGIPICTVLFVVAFWLGILGLKTKKNRYAAIIGMELPAVLMFIFALTAGGNLRWWMLICVLVIALVPSLVLWSYNNERPKVKK